MSGGKQMTRNSTLSDIQYVVTVHAEESPRWNKVFVFDSEEAALDSVKMTFPAAKIEAFTKADCLLADSSEIDHWLIPFKGRDAINGEYNLITVHRRSIRKTPMVLKQGEGEDEEEWEY
jgi:hypothetical protein